MSTKVSLVVSIMFLSTYCLQGQKISFDYDNSGNRIERMLVTEGLKSGSVEFPVTDPDNLPAEEIKKEELIQGELSAVVYPNPNKGIIKISISNMPLNSATEAILYDLSGIELKVEKNLESYNEMDVSHLKDGIYILRIRVNEKLFDWKIVKNH